MLKLDIMPISENSELTDGSVSASEAAVLETKQSTSSIANYIAENYDKVIAAESSWTTLNEQICFWVSESHLYYVVELGDTREEPLELRQHNRETEKMAVTVRRNINTILAHAKYEAQILCSGDDILRKAALERLEETQDKIDTEENDYEKLFQNMYLEAVHLFFDAYNSEKELTEPLYDLICQDAALIEELLEFFEAEETDLDDYSGLLYALARNNFDSADTPLLPAVLSALKDCPELYQRHYLQANVAGNGEEASQTQKLLMLISSFALINQLDPEAAHEFVKEVEFIKLPDSIQEEIVLGNQEHLQDIEKRFLSILQPYYQPKRHMLKSPPSSAGREVRNPKKRTSSHLSKRVTQKAPNNITFSPEEEKKKSITEVSLGKSTRDGYVCKKVIAKEDEQVNSRESWLEDAAEALLQTREFASYVKKYRNEDDVRRMIHLIIDNPTAKGVTGMTDHAIKFIGQSKTKQVLHFSPQNSAGLGLSQSTESNRTRIFFARLQDKLIFLGIMHKNEAEKIRGSLIR